MKVIKEINEKIDKLEKKLEKYAFFRGLDKAIKYINKVVLATGVVCIVGIPTYSYINTSNVKNNVIKEVVDLQELKINKEDSKGMNKYVSGFNIERDTLPFSNFSTLENPGGNCFGYNAYELLHFEGRLNEVLDNDKRSSDFKGDLRDLEIVTFDTDYVYSFREDKSYTNDYYRVSKNIQDINVEEIVDNSYKYVRRFSKVFLEIVFNLNNDGIDLEAFDFKNKDFGNILKDIDKLQLTQLEKEKVLYVSNAFNQSNWAKNLEDTVNENSLPDIDYIIDSIDNDKLIILGIMNLVDGHAVLGYGYEKIDDNNIKVYVKDSNFPIVKKDILTNEDKSFNESIKENCYILFTKDLIENGWSYIYEPNLSGNYAYGGFNSFVPGTKLRIYKI